MVEVLTMRVPSGFVICVTVTVVIFGGMVWNLQQFLCSKEHNIQHHAMPINTGAKLSPHDPRDKVLDDLLSSLLAGIESPQQASSGLYKSPVWDQGNTSCCVASSTTTMIQRQRGVTNLNPFFIYNLRSPQNEDSGMVIRDSLTLAYKFGHASYTDYPVNQVFVKKRGLTPEYLNNALYEKTKVNAIRGYGRIHDIDTLIEAIRLNSSVGYENSFGSFPIILPACSSDLRFWEGGPTDEYHCTSIIDYNDSRDSFVIQNSWGTSWGNSGFTFMDADNETFYRYMQELWFSTASDAFWSQLHGKVSQLDSYQNWQNGNLNANNINDPPVNVSNIATLFETPVSVRAANSANAQKGKRDMLQDSWITKSVLGISKSVIQFPGAFQRHLRGR